MANLYDKAGLVNIPVGYQDGFLYNIKPEDNTLGFRFNRDSAATRVNKKGLIEQVGYFGPELVQNGDFSQLGPELIVNGDFATDSDWTKGTGWSIANGKASCDGTQTSTSTLETSIGISGIQNKLVLLSFEVSNYSAGAVSVTLQGTGGIEFNNLAANGVYEISVTSTDSLPRILFNANSSFVGSIDNVSVKQVDPNDYWTLGTGWSIQSNYAQSTALNTRSIYQNIGKAVVGKKYKVTYTILETNGGNFKFVYGGVNGVIRNSIGTYTENIVATSNADANIYFDALNVMIGKISNISVTEVLGDKPRIDYTDSLTSPSFLLEPQSTNLIPYSEDFTVSNWTTLGTFTITSNYGASPDGFNNSTRIQGNNTSSLYFNPVDYSGFARSIYVKATNGSGNIQLLSHNSNTNNVFSIDENWQRVEINSTTSGTGSDSFYAFDMRGASTDIYDIEIWGAQSENNISYATSYIPTAGSTVTRAQETCVDAGNVSTFNSAEGVLYAEIAALADDGTFRYVTINDGTDQNVVAIRFSNTSNQILAFTRISGSFNAVLSTTSYSTVNFNKIAYRYKSGDFGLFINGTKISSSTSTQTLPANTLNTLNFDNAPFAKMYGKVKGVYVFNEALTDDELQQLTT